MTILTTDITQATDALKSGKLVAFPTETVYGLGGNALSDNAVAGIFNAKQRPTFNPLIIHVSSVEQAHEYALFNEMAELLAHYYWPGPLTLVLPRRPDCKISFLASAGLDTIALRMPAHPLARELLETSGLPLAAPSANRSGHISPTEAWHVMDELEGRIAMVLDGGPCRVGIESTVLDVSNKTPVMLRPGFVTREHISELVGKVSLAEEDARITAPGMLSSHYAPDHSLRLNATQVKQGEALLAFGPRIPGNADVMQNLSEGGKLEEAAANLFRMLRILDNQPVSGIAVMPIPEEGLGMAINDRLKRAAAPKTASRPASTHAALDVDALSLLRRPTLPS